MQCEIDAFRNGPVQCWHQCTRRRTRGIVSRVITLEKHAIRLSRVVCAISKLGMPATIAAVGRYIALTLEAPVNDKLVPTLVHK